MLTKDLGTVDGTEATDDASETLDAIANIFKFPHWGGLIKQSNLRNRESQDLVKSLSRFS